MKKCLEESCNKQPNFNLLNNKDGIYCSEHKKKNMVNIKSKCYLENNCKKQPAFNLPNQKVGIYCGKHKKKNML